MLAGLGKMSKDYSVRRVLTHYTFLPEGGHSGGRLFCLDEYKRATYNPHTLLYKGSQ